MDKLEDAMMDKPADLTGAAQRRIARQFAIRARLINVLNGLLLLGVGIYDLYVNWPLLQAYLT